MSYKIVTCILVTAALFSTSAFAETAQAENDWSACSAIAEPPDSVKAQLLALDTVFGKPAFEWRNSDYTQLIELAAACDGVRFSDGSMINAEQWHRAIDSAKRTILPLSLMHNQIMRQGRMIMGMRSFLPECEALIDYDAGEWFAFDNSESIFGKHFVEMTQTEIDGAVFHINNCSVFLPDYQALRDGTPDETLKSRLSDMLDTAVLIQSRLKEYETSHDWRRHRDSDVLLEVNGYIIPPTFAGVAVRDLIRQYNRHASYSSGIGSEAVVILMGRGDEILKTVTDPIDIGYTEEILARVQSGLFDNQDYAIPVR